MAGYRPQSPDASLQKYESEASILEQTSGRPARTFTMKSSVADSHARTVAALHAPDVPSEVNNFQTYFIGVTICMGAVAYGYDTGFFGGTIALQSFKTAFGLNSSNSSNTSANLVSLFQAGSFFGAGLQLPMTTRFGRKWSIIISNLIFIVSAIVQTFANGSVGTMMGGRFLGGLAIGISSLVIPVYLSEFAPASIRGRLVGFYDIGIQIGTVVGFWINYALGQNWAPSKFQWQFPVIVQLFPAALLGIGMFFVPETPRFLMMQGKHDQAEATLCRIRKLPLEHEYLQWELKQTRAQVEAEALVRGDDSLWDVAKALFRSPGHRKRLLLGLGLLFFKTFSGVQAVNYYSPRIFQQLGFNGTQNSLFATGIYGSVKAIFTLVFGFFIVDRVGRRRPLMVGSLVGSLCLFFIGGYLLGVGPRDGSNGARTAGDYVAIVAIFLYAAWYCLGWNSVPLTLISEIFTMRFKMISMTFCLMWQWLCTFAVVRIMPVALTNVGAKTYFIFGSIFFCSTIFVFFLIPETKGLPLEAMDHLFGVAELTDAERAVMNLEEGKDNGTTAHLEHAGYANAAATVHRSNTVEVMAPIDEAGRRV
ncbi:and other transporter-domain-containing protein [Leucosporidium creatinivorum]|uniref:Quinate transporter n=1 Tax=Leucosporidium creatinivorum TaxID=106004 RepID=A0A1Y2EZ16_9BASI|nr:and other transporter-domain-containing protein [Leucosporidium creatinivorum]